MTLSAPSLPSSVPHQTSSSKPTSWRASRLASCLRWVVCTHWGGRHEVGAGTCQGLNDRRRSGSVSPFDRGVEHLDRAADRHLFREQWCFPAASTISRPPPPPRGRTQGRLMQRRGGAPCPGTEHGGAWLYDDVGTRLAFKPLVDARLNWAAVAPLAWIQRSGGDRDKTGAATGHC